jgi:hypothetical protein
MESKGNIYIIQIIPVLLYFKQELVRSKKAVFIIA